MSDRLLTRAEAAEMVGVTESLVRTAARDHALAYVKTGRTFRFREDDVRAWVESMRVPADKRKAHTFHVTSRSMARGA